MTDSTKVPVHVSMIMDGNGRWAKERGLERVRGHFEGVESVRACTEAAVEAGVKYLSIFAFSEENWNRPEAEVTTLMSLMAKCIAAETPTFHKNQIRFRVLGNKDRLSKELNAAIEATEQETAAYDRLTMIVFLSYSGKWDIMQAARKMALEAVSDPAMASSLKDLTINDFDKYLVTSGVPDPDLIIRTSGESRISNYMLWQSAYSEFYFTPVLWPDFRKPQFREALEVYAKRDRRYGKVK